MTKRHAELPSLQTGNRGSNSWHNVAGPPPPTPQAKAAVRFKAVVLLLLLTFCLLLLPLWEFGVVLCFVVCYFMSILVLLAIILMGKRELVALLYLSPWCLVMVELLFLAVPRLCLRFVIVVFPDHTHFLFLKEKLTEKGIFLKF